MTAMQHAHKKEGNAQMAFTAKLDMLRHNASKLLEGGGPHTLICKECDKAFDWGDEISGPTRNRAGVPCFDHHYPERNKAHYHKLQYWHQDCKHPKGVLRNLPAEVEVIVGSNNKDGWQRPTPPIALPPPVITPHTPVLPAPDNTQTDVVTAIMQVINGHLLPELEKVTDALDTKIDAAHNEFNAHCTDNVTNFRTLSTSLAITVTNLDAITTRIAAIEGSQVRPLQIVVNNGSEAATPITLGLYHHNLPRLIRLLKSLHPERRNVWLTGPAGSGKTTAAKQVAQALSMPDRYFFNGSIDTEYKLAGFVDANGNIVSTAFREAWTHGGVYLFDECDSSMPGALLAFNGALANGSAPFPGVLHPVPRHANTFIIAAANTWGFGGDSNYVGRAKLDGAFLSRFIRIPWDYDERLERAISGSSPATNAPPVYESTVRDVPATESTLTRWVNAVRRVREAAASAGAFFLITPRDSLNGSDLLRAGYTNADVVEEIFGYIMRQDADTWRTIGTAAREFATVS